MRLKLLLGAVLVGVTLAVFWPVRQHDFVNYDDPDYITENLHVQGGFTPEAVTWAFANVHGEKTYWHPLTWLSHLLDCQLFGLNPGPPHLVNVAIHAANALLIFLLFTRLTGAVWPSALLAALFALHPLQVDTVAWITERKNVLSTFFLLLTIGSYVSHARRPSWGGFARVLVCFALALMCKPAVVVLPCLLLLLDFWPLQRFAFARTFGQTPTTDAEAPVPPCPLQTLRQLAVEKIPLFALSLASSWLTMAAHQGLGMIDEAASLSYRLRVENAVVSYARYLRKIVWPVDLAVLYPHPGRWAQWQVLAAGALLLVVTAVVVRWGRRRPYLIVGWLWFLGALVPAIGIVQVGVQAMADRFVYVPLLGVFLMAAWTLASFAAGSPLRARVAAGLGCVALAYFVSFTSVQIGYWRNSITLWEHTLRVTRNNFTAHHDLGMALAQTNRLDDGLAHLHEALRMRTNALTSYGLGVTLLVKGQTNEAITYLEQTTRLNPRWILARQTLGSTLLAERRYDDAIAQFSEWRRLNPADLDARCQLAAARAAQGDLAQAIDDLNDALRINPDHLSTLNSLAWLYATNPKDEFRNGLEAVRLAGWACQLTGWRQPLFLATMAAVFLFFAAFASFARPPCCGPGSEGGNGVEWLILYSSSGVPVVKTSFFGTFNDRQSWNWLKTFTFNGWKLCHWLKALTFGIPKVRNG